MIDIPKIKKYVFGSPYLVEIRGASALLDELNRNRTKKIIKRVTGSDEWLVYSAGGSTLIELEEKTDIELIIKEIKKEYREKTNFINVIAEYIEYRPSKEDKNEFQSVMWQLFQKVQKKAEEFLLCETGIPNPLVRFCDSCGQHPAEIKCNNNNEKEELICQVCNLKRKYSREMKRSQQLSFFMNEFAEVASNWNKEYISKCQIDTIDDIGRVSKVNNRIALIYCDGNRMGQRIRQIASIKDYKEFATGIDKAIRGATYETLAEFLSPEKSPDEPDKKVFPFEILLIGGDDLILVMAAERALKVTAEISKRFSQKTEEYCKQRLTLSAGVVFAHYHHPINLMVQSAESLLKSAKKVVLPPDGSGKEEPSIDFLELAEFSGANVVSSRKEKYTYFLGGETFELIGRPYTFSKLEEKVIKHIRKLKQTNFPMNKLNVIRQSLFQGKIKARYQTIWSLGRINDQSKKDVLEKFFEVNNADKLPPWEESMTKKKGKIYRSNLLDLIELYPYVLESEVIRKDEATED